jgi:hypothetical protein
MSDHIHQTINKLDHCVHCGEPMDKPSPGEGAKAHSLYRDGSASPVAFDIMLNTNGETRLETRPFSGWVAETIGTNDMACVLGLIREARKANEQLRSDDLRLALLPFEHAKTVTEHANDQAQAAWPTTLGAQFVSDIETAKSPPRRLERMVRRRPRLMLKDDWRLVCEVMELVIGRAEERYKQQKRKERNEGSKTRTARTR